MKKTNLIIAGLVVTNLLAVGSMIGMSNDHKEIMDQKSEIMDSYEKMTSRYYNLKEDYESLDNDLKEKDTQIYKIMEGKNYDVTIQTEDGAAVNYKKTGKGWIRDESKTVIY